MNCLNCNSELEELLFIIKNSNLCKKCFLYDLLNHKQGMAKNKQGTKFVNFVVEKNEIIKYYYEMNENLLTFINNEIIPLSKIVLIVGCSGSGKTTKALEMKGSNDTILNLDNFYFPKPPNSENYNFDSPDALDWNLFLYVLKSLKLGNDVVIKKYSKKTNNRTDEDLIIKSGEIIYVEGTLVAYLKEIRELSNEIIFVKTPLDQCLLRRMKRDKEIGRDYEKTALQWSQVRDSYQKYIKPLKKEENIKIIFN